MKTKKQKTYTSATGVELPSKLLRKVDKKRHDTALKFFKEAEMLQEKILNFKNKLLSAGDILHADHMAEYNVKPRENARGGYTLSTIDKEIQIEFTVGSRVQFDDRVDAAKEKFFEYIDEVTQGIAPEIRQIVETSFQTTRGKLDPKKVLQLLTLKIDHPIWKAATELLTQSMSTNLTKRYVQFKRKDAEGKYTNLILDFNAL